MTYKTSEIINFIESWASPSYELSFDNSGEQIFFDEEVDCLLLSLDLYDEVIKMAKKEKAKMIITHHPMFFSGIKKISEKDYLGKNIIDLIDSRISVYSSHTPLDIAEMGVNDTIADFLQIIDRKALSFEEENPIGISGSLKESCNLKEILNRFENELDIKNIRVYGRNEKIDNIKNISICGGAGADFIRDAVKNKSEVLITSDVKYHDGQFAYENDLIVVDISHFHSEKIILDRLKEKLEEKFSDLKIIVNKNSNYLLNF